jgi:flagellar hook assembly protein FlgD
VLNNPSERTLSFVVGDPERFRIQRVLNYPNPFSGRTTFWFEHNAPGQNILVSVEVMTLTGRVVRTLQGQFLSEGSFCRELEWDGRDEQGDRLGRGTYLYRLKVRAAGLGSAEHLGKLVIL